MHRLKYSFYVLILILISSLSSVAQDDIPEYEDIPVDGGVGLLVAAGAAWGIKKLKDKKTE